MLRTADELWMERALSLARATAGQASPNPQVGCVLVRDGKVVAEGSHFYAARDHAEVVALRKAGAAARGATAYVTLEPCSHFGRTGPCADALIAAGVGRCVVATADPNPRVRGAGIARMREAGVEVEVGVLEAEARAVNDAFAWSIQYGRPFVTLKAALSMDGRLAPPPGTRVGTEPHWLTGPEARAEVQRMRHAADALITGIGTVLADNPLLTDRTGLARRRPLLRVVLDSELRIPLQSKLVRSAAADLLVVCRAGASGKEELDACGVAVLALDGGVDAGAVLEELGSRQMISVLLEAGAQVNGAFLRGDHVQEVALFYSETELGEGAVPFAIGIASPFALEERLRQIRRARFGSDALVTGYLHDPWATAAIG